MSDRAARRRIWGWYFFDWASQPYHTLLVTFVFGPYFASVAAAHFMATGLTETAADARAQSLWSLGLTITGLIIGFGTIFGCGWISWSCGGFRARIPGWISERA